MAKKTRRKKTKRRASEKSPDYIPNAELDVLACVWQEGPVTARRIREKMLKYRPMAHGSVVTLLTRLENKGMVTKEKGPVGKAFLFRTTRKPDSIHKKLVKDMVTRVFAGDTGGMVTALLDAHQPTKDELAEIQSAVNRAKKKAKKTRR
ncbi:MAG: BlaI/MecI/CopY family transcriptional regulator [Phycisphaerales bacterium]|nr:BlaI/MecI/CopY family transcriptional regulator [Phycisphaerales bacterium]